MTQTNVGARRVLYHRPLDRDELMAEVGNHPKIAIQCLDVGTDGPKLGMAEIAAFELRNSGLRDGHRIGELLLGEVLGKPQLHQAMGADLVEQLTLRLSNAGLADAAGSNRGTTHIAPVTKPNLVNHVITPLPSVR
jgi:hypothetical protein